MCDDDGTFLVEKGKEQILEGKSIRGGKYNNKHERTERWSMNEA